ncbi:septum formation initiator family protein [Patescibacteria group bacterium]|nr:septum formation initiator family protein [Patescibacteria group bacterium]
MRKDIDLGKRILSSKFLLLLSLFILIFFSVNLVKEVINRRDLKKEVNKLQGEINNLEEKNKELADLIGYFESIEFVETEARTKLNLRKPGEKIIIIPEEGTPTSTEEKITSAPENLIASQAGALSNPQKWWNYFFKIY